MEADCLARVLDDIDQLGIADEVSDENSVLQVSLKSINFTLAAPLELLDF